MDSQARLADRSALVLYGSETGTAQELAGEIGRLLERLHFATRIEEFNRISVDDFSKYAITVFAISTTGQGDLPGNSKTFWRHMRSVRLKSGCLSDLNFASFGLGDSSYPQFNWAHRKLYNRLLQLGARPLCDRGESDEQHPDGVDGLFIPWIVKLRETLLKLYPLPADVGPIPDDVFLTPKWQLLIDSPAGHINGNAKVLQPSQDDPTLPNDELLPIPDTVTSEMLLNKRVTPDSHWQDVRFLEFSTPAIDYSPGDVLTIFPKNFPEDVDNLLSIMGWTSVADEQVHFSRAANATTTTPAVYPPAPLSYLPTDAPQTLRRLLTHYLDITSIPRRSFFSLVAHFTADETQKERLLEFTQSDLVDELYDYTTRPRRSIIEVLQEFDTVKIPLKWVCAVLPTMRGRQFSIASGGKLKEGPSGEGRVQLLVAIVKYRTVIKKIRRGVCTRYLESLKPGAKLNVLFSKGGMKLAMDRPAIMIGPGTGVAPLRSMIYERLMLAGLSASKPSVVVDELQLLFYGGRNMDADFFFSSEWSALKMEAKASLQVIPAFSRDQKAKLYVQDRIREHSSAVYNYLTAGGVVYLCGSSGKMPQAVREALIEVVQSEANTSREEAEQFFMKMEKIGLYQQETW